MSGNEHEIWAVARRELGGLGFWPQDPLHPHGDPGRQSPSDLRAGSSMSMTRSTPTGPQCAWWPMPQGFEEPART